MSRKDQTVRRRRYDQLKQAGFTSREATKYKDLSDLKIDQLVEIKRRQEEKRLAMIATFNTELEEALDKEADSGGKDSTSR